MNREKKRREYQRLLDNLRAIARSEEQDWDEQDWRRALRRATTGKPGELRPAWKPRPAWAWAYAAVMVILLGAAAVAVRSFFHAAGPTLLARVEPARSGGPAPAGGTGSPTPQNQLSVTLVSGESGLRVYWYFDKEFDWEEKTP
jgi:hypothetical protein